MPLTDPIVTARILDPIVNFVAKRGRDPSTVLMAVGLSADDLTPADTYISLNLVGELFEVAARQLNDPAFGVHYAEEFPVGGTGLFGHVLLSAPTVGQALQAAQKYLDLLMQPMQAKLYEDGGAHVLEVAVPPSFRAPQLHYMSFLMAALVLRIRAVAGATWHPLMTEFKHREPDAIEEYRRILGRNMAFNAACYRITIDAPTLSKPMQQQIEGLYDSLLRLADHVLPETRLRQDVTEQTAAVVMRQLLDIQAFDLASVAAHAGVTPRALQWRLEQMGTNYDRIVVRVRQELAAQLLRDTDLSIGEIAVRLGYSEQSAFARASQQWFQRSPTAHRQLLRSQLPVSGDADTP